MPTEDEQAARKTALDEQYAEINKRNTEAMERAAKVRPTPTQREVDLARLGCSTEFDQKEDDGSGTEEEQRTRQLEPAPLDPKGEYQTREAQKRGPGRPRKEPA